MPEWMSKAIVVDPPITVPVMAARIAMALLMGGLVAAIYRATHGRRARDAGTLTTTLVLLAGLLAMVSMVIGDSVARAFGLVGALSIVRFRTVVEDTRDTAFVICSVIVGMAVGTGLLLVAVVGVPLVGLAALAMRELGRGTRAGARERYELKVRVAIGRDPDGLLPVIRERAGVTAARVTGAKTARQGAVVDALFEVELRGADLAGLVMALNGADGVQEVDATRLAGDSPDGSMQ